MKILITIFFLLPIIVLSQETFNLDCEKGIEKMDTISLSQKNFTYKVVSVKKLYSKGSLDYYDGILILPKSNNNLTESEKTEVINKIGKQYKVNELLVFKNCESIRIYYQGMKLLSGQKKYLKENFIGNFKIE